MKSGDKKVTFNLTPGQDKVFESYKSLRLAGEGVIGISRKIAELIGSDYVLVNRTLESKKLKQLVAQWEDEHAEEAKVRLDETDPDAFTMAWLMRNYQNLYAVAMKTEKFSEARNLLDDIKDMMNKFGMMIEETAKMMTALTDDDLIKEWYKAGTKLLGNERAKALLVKLMKEGV